MLICQIIFLLLSISQTSLCFIRNQSSCFQNYFCLIRSVLKQQLGLSSLCHLRQLVQNVKKLLNLKVIFERFQYILMFSHMYTS